MRLLDTIGPSVFYVVMAAFVAVIAYGLFTDTFVILYGVAWLFIPALLVAALSAPYYLWTRIR